MPPEQLKIALLEKNDKVISHLEKMGEADESESLQAAVSKELSDAMAIDEAVNEEFVVYCQRTQKNLAEGHQRNEVNGNDEEIETGLVEMATNAPSKAHMKNVHKKPIKMQSDISLKDFKIWKRKFSDYLIKMGLNDAPRQTSIATFRAFLSSDIYNKI